MKISVSLTLILGAMFATTHAASLQGLQALGEDNWPGDAAALGRGYAGSAILDEGYSLLNPSRMAFETKTRFYATLDYQGVYATSGSQSIGRDRFDLTSVGLSIPMGGIGALGLGFWQRNSQTLNLVETTGGVETASVRYVGSIYELVPAYAWRLPGSARFISLGASWHFPMGHFKNTLLNTVDTSGLDDETGNLFDNLAEEDMVSGEWGCKTSEFAPFGGYASFSIQVHRKYWDYFVSGAMPHTLTRTVGRSHQYQYTLIDTTAEAKWHQNLEIPWQWGTGVSLEPWDSQVISLEFHQRSFGDQVDTGLGWAGLPSSFRWTSNQRILSLGWQRTGSGIYFDRFMKRNTFRAGAWVRSWYLDGVEEAAGSIGFGMPLGKRGAKLDLALYTGLRSFDEPTQGTETFWGLKAGFSGIGAWGQSSRRR